MNDTHTHVSGGMLVHVDKERGRVLLTLCPDDEQMLVVQVHFDGLRALALAEAIRAAGLMVIQPAGKGPQ